MCILYRYSSSTVVLSKESLQRIFMSSYTSLLQNHFDIARSDIYFFEFSFESMRVTRLDLFMFDIIHVN